MKLNEILVKLKCYLLSDELFFWIEKRERERKREKTKQRKKCIDRERTFHILFLSSGPSLRRHFKSSMKASCPETWITFYTIYNRNLKIKDKLNFCLFSKKSLIKSRHGMNIIVLNMSFSLNLFKLFVKLQIR